MLARSTKQHHPLGVTLETPILVPSFSSKGFLFGENGTSEVKEIFDVASEYLTDSMLVSAYDLAYGHLEPIESSITDITIVDSGGYEVSDFQDLSSITRQLVQPQAWTQEQLQAVYDSWPAHIPAVFVSYDHPAVRQPLREQIVAARSLFKHYPDQLHTLLIKPETKQQRYVNVTNVTTHIEELRSFNMVGLTEKELGNSILNRMKAIADIRLAMDDAQINVPIHIFGSLDPIASVLYFLAGAEVFDGLTWLRYGYGDGLAYYRYNYGAIRIGIEERDSLIRAKTMQDNLGYLRKLTLQMRKYLLDYDFEQLRPHSEFFREALNLLRTRNRRIR